MDSISYSLAPAFGAGNVTKGRNSLIFNFPCENLDNCGPYKVDFKPGYFKIECWGAGGKGVNSEISSHGGYTKGVIHFNHSETLYFHLGSFGGKYNVVHPDAVTVVGLNGGGATDVRLSSLPYYDFSSLKSRIIVAGGGGVRDYFWGSIGNGGGLVAEPGIVKELNDHTPVPWRYMGGGNQTSGGTTNFSLGVKGEFGLSGYVLSTKDWGASGGGGYYGGASTGNAGISGGGSSFLSGYPGCDAIEESSTENKTKHSGKPIHYSGYVFSEGVIQSGSEVFPSPQGQKIKGNPGFGVIRVSPLILVPHLHTCVPHRRYNNNAILVNVLILSSRF